MVEPMAQASARGLGRPEKSATCFYLTRSIHLIMLRLIHLISMKGFFVFIKRQSNLTDQKIFSIERGTHCT
jgi:hypothetical protein